MFVRLALIAILVAGCEKTTHENIDKLTHTEKGPDKLRHAVADESIDPDLSAHAAANMMVKTGKDKEALDLLNQMSTPRRDQVIAKLAPRLWELARVEGDMTKPSSTQVIAKDELVSIRKLADDATRQQIDTYLVDWYGVASYEGRAELGANAGSTVMRLIGDRAAKKLIEVGNGVIAAPGQGKAMNKIGDNLLLGLAATCTTDTVNYVLDIAKMGPERHDDSLAGRALNALYLAYVNPGGLIDVCPPAPLAPAMDRLVAVAKDEGLPGDVAQDAIKLISTAGPPACVAPLVGLVGHPHPNPIFKYAIAQAALRCGGAGAIKDVVEALPDVPYEVRLVDDDIAGEIKRLSPRPQVLATLRELLDDKRPVPRWVAIEALALMGSTEDAPRIAAVKSSEKLAGFWGDQSDADPKDRKADPTLGQRAKELAAKLEKGGK